MGKRFGDRLKQQADLSFSSKGGEDQEEEKGPSPAVSDNDTDYDEEQYPPAEDIYKHLEDCLSAIEIRKFPCLDFGELGLVSGVVIPHKFKAPIFPSMMEYPVQNSISNRMSEKSNPILLI